MIQHILLATDGSTQAEQAAEFAASLALRFHAKITVLHAFMPAAERVIAGGIHEMPRNLEAAQKRIALTARRLAEMGVQPVEVEVVEGPATSVIIGMAETCQPDMIVIGARGQGTWAGHILGSVCMAVTQRVECPVLVVK